MNKLIKALIILISTSVINYSQVQEQWVKLFGIGGSRSQYINTDSSGNAYVVGSCTGMDSPIYPFIQVFNPDGTEMWSHFITTPCDPLGVNMDSLNNTYIAGYYPGGWGPANFAVFKYTYEGVLEWSDIDSIVFDDHMNAMTGDKAGNSFIVKYKGGERLLEKLNSSDVQQFLINITDTLDTKAIALDNEDNIIVWGSANSGGSNTGVVIKYNPNSIKQWKRIYIPEAGTSLSSRMKISVSDTGNIYLLCTTLNVNNIYQYTLLKYNPQGIQQWVRYYNINGQSCYAYSIYVESNADNSENILIVGSKGTVKFNTSGSPLWFDTTSGMSDIKPDKINNYYLTGSAADNHSDFRTIKLSNNGIKLWDITYNGTYNYTDYASSLAIDKTGNVYVTGMSNQIPLVGSGSGTTIKYSQYEIDNTFSNFLPLYLGNIWVYKHYTNTPPNSTFEYRGKVKYQIVRDTLMYNGKRYYDRTYLGYTRINPENLSVFVYAGTGEVKKDSLKAKLLDTVITCYHVTDTSGTTVFGDFRRNKFVETFCAMTNQQYFWNLTYGLGYWTYSNITDGTIVGFTDTLVGAVINGIVYGDTTMDAIRVLSNHVPQYYKIYQNYPNPFNPKSKIKFDISKLGDVKLIIFDVLGREIETLVNERLKAGTYEAEWDAVNYPSGVYFYKLITSDYTETKKMVLVK